MKRGKWMAPPLVLAVLAVVGACGGRTSLGHGHHDAGTVSDAGDAGPPKLSKSNKADVLFAIDNSASMGDKQELLNASIPYFIDRLVNPFCINPGQPDAPPVAAQNGSCPAGTQREFAPFVDIHVGIVTSSLGGGGAPDICQDDAKNPIAQLAKLSRHNNDKGELINRKRPDLANPPPSGVEATVANAQPVDGTGGDFLAWLPPVQANANKPSPNVPKETDQQTFATDFQDLVGGVQEFGCGLEAQLESWYRFLVQPDPWNAISLDPNSGNPAKAQLVGIDANILKQRHDFLRPDSLVMIIQLTDEEDSWSDPLALGGRGWVSRTLAYPGSPFGQAAPRATHECDEPVNPNDPMHTGPNDPDCTSCGFVGNKAKSGTPISQDPSCQIACGNNCQGFYTLQQDGINVRYTNDMKRRYGYDPQFPVSRYVDGLTSRTVPDRDGEHPNGNGSYVGTKDCQNPLFAASLPTDPNGDLCHLDDGPRGTGLVYYLIIGGVPWQLLAQDPFNTTAPLKSTLTAGDWQRIVGKDPATYQTEGIDPHMLESIDPRAGLPPPSAADDTDPIHGREWNTHKSPVGLDLQYACTFPLTTPKDCTDPQFAPSCDCVGSATSADGPPLCDPNNRKIQIRGKAYPTIRQLRLAEGLGDQGVVASICPRPGEPSTENPFFDVLFQRIRSHIIQ